jgi:hypothetical protein
MSILSDWLLQPVITILNRLERQIAMNQAELAQALTDAKDQAAKAKAEIVAKVAALEDAINNSGNTTPEVDAALAALKGEVQGLDDLNPDTPA